jgi:uncharacterized lipoprotein NlpE involved in copper resistance
MMKKLILILTITVVLFVAGCINKSDYASEAFKSPISTPKPTFTEQASIPTPPKSTPENTMDKYVFCYNRLASKCVYDLFSSGKQLSEDEVHNTIYALRSQGVKIDKYEIIDKSVNESTATLNVRITWDLMGYRQTKGYNVKLILENSEWKLNTSIIVP